MYLIIDRILPHTRYRLRTVFWGPLLVGLLIVVLFALIPQSREVYLGIIEGNELLSASIGLVLVLFLCALLNCWQHALSTNAIDRSYLEHGDRAIDRIVITMRNVLTSICAFLPLVGLALGLLKLIYDAGQAHTKFENAIAHLAGASWRDSFPEFSEANQVLSLVPVYLTAAAVFAAAMLFLIFRYALPRDILHRWGWWIRAAVIAGGGIITLSAMVVPLLCRDCVVAAAQASGPLAAGTVVLIAAVSCLMFVSILSNIRRWPIIGLAIFGLILLMVWQIWGALALPQKVARSGSASGRLALHSATPLHDQFDAWFNARKAADLPAYDASKGRNGRYPVFIFAAQGGGIYATSAAASFLAALQDTCPNFAQHIFAISGVSGGAVGAAVFSALNADLPLVDTVGCKTEVGAIAATSLSEATKRIVRQDHLSPTLALIWPDILRKFAPDGSFDRSSVLERSLACAFETPKAWSACTSAGPAASGKGLRIPFSEHWKPDKRAPALVLNTTWVESGFRVAFAPFPLHAISDGTLYSFYSSDRGTGPKGDFELLGARVPASRSLIEAAFVSARFPLIVPAWPIDATITGSTDARRWNFVDGGYVDNSGASTALELYSALQKHVVSKSYPIDLYLVLLTGADADPGLRDIADGTRFSDTVAPITALLSVRGQLASRAVTRAIDELEPSSPPGLLAGRAGETKVLVVNQRQNTFDLPLGWKISQTTDDIVRLMLGRPDLCSAPSHGQIDDAIADAVAVIRDNSCVKQRIIDLLEGKRGVPTIAPSGGQ